METKKPVETRESALCGFTKTGKFLGDICPQSDLTYWRCYNCRYTITAAMPPAACPSCNQKTMFINITCYAPECGGPGKMDPRL